MPSTRHLISILLFLSLLGNGFLFYSWQKASQSENNLTAFSKKYPLIAFNVIKDVPNDPMTNFLPLRDKINHAISPYKDKFAFYFEYLPTGTSIGINEDDQFTAASLLKVPVVMAYFHMKERLNIREDKTVVLKESELNSRFGNLYKKGAGYQINLGDAVKLALQQSDNTASLVLADQISEEDFQYVYEGLDIPMVEKDGNPLITAQQYTSIYKALYYSSLLKIEDSQKVLALLTHTSFNNMLPAGVPSDIKVAHKIGLIDKQIYQDCGIVYAPNRPYLLCMISKSDKTTAANRMQNLSKMVYGYVTSLKNE